jgi:hypothetical protein
MHSSMVTFMVEAIAQRREISVLIRVAQAFRGQAGL